MSVDYIARGLALRQGATVTPEEVQDIVANLLVAGANISLVYDDTLNTLTIAATVSGGIREFGTYLQAPIENNEVVLGYTATQDFTLAANFVGWRINVVANPVDTVTFSVRKNGVEFGTFQIDNTGTTTFGAHAAQSIVDGDMITIVAPADVETDGPDLEFSITGQGTF